MNPYQLFRKLLPHFPSLTIIGKGYTVGNEQVVEAVIEGRQIYVNVSGLSIVDWGRVVCVTLEEARIRHA